MGLTLVLLYTCFGFATILFYFAYQRKTYWKRRGILHDEPHFLFGNMVGVSRTRSLIGAIDEVYKKYKGTGPFCGFYFLVNPSVLVLDLDLVKRVLIKDFHNFDERGTFHNERDDPLSANLFSMDGDKWRPLRKKLSPTFTSGKMKFMFPTVVEVGHRFAETFGKTLEAGSVLEIKDILGRFTTDVIGTCAFGIDCNSLKDPNTEFLVMGRKVFKGPRHSSYVNAFMQSCPNLCRKLRMQQTPDDVEDFYRRVVRETMELRKKHGTVRNDFMSLLIDLKNRVADGLTMDEVVSQSLLFFLAGFETSSSTMSFALYELAKNQAIQDRLRKEVHDVLQRHNGEFTYECMKEMAYLDQVIYETLRLHSIVPFLQRRARNNYYIDDPKYFIEKGTTVIIPSTSIQMDPDYYPEPKKFDPERFNPEEIQKRDSITWLPFGDGPRNCIGLRFGKMQARIGLTLLIKDYKFRLCAKTVNPMVYDVTSFTLQAKDGIYLKGEKL